MTRQYTTHPVWTWKCDTCGREVHLAREQKRLPTPGQMRYQGWYIAPRFGDMCPECVATTGWRDRHGDVWTEGADGLMHSPETAPFPREHVEKKWGPLVRVSKHDDTPSTNDSHVIRE